MLLQLAILLFLAQACQSLSVPLNATTITPALLAQACLNQGTRSVCFPLSASGKDYIKCGAKPTPRKCTGGKMFDYVERTCIASKAAQPCPSWNCPAGPGPALGRPLGVFGRPGNATITLTKKESFKIECPINGHCMGGMNIDVLSECPAPPDRTPYTFIVDWDQTLTNSMAYPKRLADIYGYCGDQVLLIWDEPIHLVQVFNTSTAAKPLWKDMSVVPYPPQPVYSCPSWDTDMTGAPIPRPSDEVLLSALPGPANVTWNATKPETTFFVCPVDNHCALGMIFKATVKAAPMGYMPKRVTVPFFLTYDLFADLDLTVGDSVYFSWPAQMYHALYKTSNITSL